MNVRLYPLLLLVLSSCEPSPPEQCVTATVQLHRPPGVLDDAKYLKDQIQEIARANPTLDIQQEPEGSELIRISSRLSDQNEAKLAIESSLQSHSTRFLSGIPERIENLDTEISRSQSSVGSLKKSLCNGALGQAFKMMPERSPVTDRVMRVYLNAYLEKLIANKDRLNRTHESNADKIAAAEINDQINLIKALTSNHAPAYADDAYRELRTYFKKKSELTDAKSQLATLRAERRKLDYFVKFPKPLFTIQSWDHNPPSH